MKIEKKSTQIIVRITEKEKYFLIHQAAAAAEEEEEEEENRTISAIVKIALVEKYADKL